MDMLHLHLKNLLRLGFMLAVAAVIFSSCQKVVNLDLNTANAQIVIIGYVTDQPGMDTVKITKSGSYFNSPTYPPVTNARVIISDNTGISDTLVQVDSGVYAAATPWIGVPGRTYTMNAYIGGKEYTGISTMPQPVNIDSIQIYNTGTINVVNGVSDTTDHVTLLFP